MSKKLLIGIVPLLASAAFAVTPAVAAPHYFQEKTEVTTSIPVVSWGTLHLKSVAGEVSCENAVLGSIENPAPNPGGPAGVGKTFNFATANCTSPTCTGTESVAGIDPNVTGHTWTSVLEGSPIKNKQLGVDVVIKCTAPASEAPFVSEPLSEEIKAIEEAKVGHAVTFGIGKQFPGMLNGGAAKENQSTVEFSGASGELCIPSEASPICGKTTGHLKSSGFKSLELITTN